MYFELVLVVGFLHVASAMPGRFDAKDGLPKAPEDLQFAFIIVRHGITSPKNSVYESEEEFLKMWPEGQESLTEQGQQLMYLVGQSLRTRYERLVPDYRKDRVELTSSTDIRATLSTYTVAAGLLPPPPEKPVIQDMPYWQPVPVFHNTEYDKAHLFDEDQENASCPRYAKIRDSIIKDEMTKLKTAKLYSVRKINSELKQNSNSQVKTIISLDEAFNVWERYSSEELSENTPPGTWTPGRKTMQGLTQLAHFKLWSRMNGKMDGENSILQYFTGPLLNEIFTEMIRQQTACMYSLMAEAAEGTPRSCFRLRLHGTTDLTVDALMWALADWRTYMSSPGDAVILEVDQLSRVKMYLYSPLTPNRNKLKDMSLKKLCNPKSCTYDQLIKNLKKPGLLHSESDWKQKCSNVEKAEKTKWRNDLQP